MHTIGPINYGPPLYCKYKYWPRKCCLLMKLMPQRFASVPRGRLRGIPISPTRTYHTTHLCRPSLDEFVHYQAGLAWFGLREHEAYRLVQPGGYFDPLVLARISLPCACGGVAHFWRLRLRRFRTKRDGRPSLVWSEGWDRTGEGTPRVGHHEGGRPQALRLS